MADRKTDMMDGELLPYPVAAETTLEAGKMGAINTSGYAVEAADSTTISVVIGRIEDRVDNSAGADGDADVVMRRGKLFKWANDPSTAAGAALTIASVGNVVYVKDDCTVSGITNTAGVRAGHALKVDSNGVWVEHDLE